MRRRRNAYTLIETLTAMSVMGLLLMLTSATLFSLFACQRQLNEHTVAFGSLSKLSLQLRADAHQARQADLRPAVDGQPVTLTLRMLDEAGDQRIVEYLADSAGVRRIVTRGGEPVHRELYRLSSRDVARWQLTDEKPPRLVLRIGPATGNIGAAGVMVGEASTNIAGDARVGDAKDNDLGIAAGPTDTLWLETRVGLLAGGIGEEGGP